jgi:hypothetical protein
MRRFSVLLAVVLVALGATDVLAQAEVIPEKMLEEVHKIEGWDFLLTPSASLALSDNRSVVGQAEGLTMTVGAKLAAGTFFRKRAHEWRTILDVTEMFSQTPSLEEFVKSTDIVKLESIYLFHLLKWLGPFAKVNLDSNLLEGFDIRPERVTYSITYLDGSAETRSGFRLRLTDGFEPLVLKETAGFFAKPCESKSFSVEGKLGFGGMHVFANEGLTVKDDGGTPEIEVVELDGFSQAGGVIDLAVFGELYDKKLTYRVSAEVMMPFVNDLREGDGRGIGELTNIELNAAVSFKVLEWLSIDYVLRVVRLPQLLDEWQVQNNLLLTASYTFFKPKHEEKKEEKK